MARYQVYWHPGTCSRITVIALEEIGEPFETVLVDMTDRSFSGGQDYFLVNPKGKVPALRVGDRTLTETPAIVTYLAQKHPDAGLLPQGEMLPALEMMSWFAAGVHRHITLFRFPRVFCDEPAAYPSMRQIAGRELTKAFAILEERLRGREWVFGEWSVVDAYMLWLWFRATGSGLDGRVFPRCADLAARCEARPTVAKVLDLEERTYQCLIDDGRANGDPDYQAGRAPVFPAVQGVARHVA